ncbi:hypothetical protein MMC12_006447 [Toensbergia leucococca]|nr:hypothetical protein [Toensbergia leucococca]
MLSLRALVPIPPVAPDFYLCDPEYGYALETLDCNLAADLQLPRGRESVNAFLNNPRMPFSLPFTVTHGSCAISIEFAGPSYAAPSFVTIVPDQLRGMASYVIDQCVRASGSGGFITRGMISLVGYLSITPLFVNPLSVPADPWFTTVTITGPDAPLRRPGDTDPEVSSVIMEADRWLAGHHAEGSEDRVHFLDLADRSEWRAHEMRRGGSLNWWDPYPTPVSEMTYVCDANLGSPAVVDCNQLQWRRLGPASDSVDLRPAEPKFFSTNSCSLVISAITMLSVTWGQLQIALETLMNSCIENPLRGPQGGRAYFGAQASSTNGKVSGTSSHEVLTGLNALPPYVNMTIFAHSGSSNLSCEWQAVRNGIALSTCETP